MFLGADGEKAEMVRLSQSGIYANRTDRHQSRTGNHALRETVYGL